MNAEEKYADILPLPHHVSLTHPHLSRADRAAQFSAFAALTGYEQCIEEAGRLTEARFEPGDEQAERIDFALRLAGSTDPDRPEITITYFIPDESKPGGRSETVHGRIRRVDSVQGKIQMEDFTEILLDDITDARCELPEAEEFI